MYQLYIGDVDESIILQIVNNESHELSWILPTALCNELKLPIIFFTKLPHFPVIPLLLADLHLKDLLHYLYKAFWQIKVWRFGSKEYQTLSLLDEKFVLPSKKANLEYQPKTSSPLQYQNNNIFCGYGRGRDKGDVNKEQCVSKECLCNDSSMGCKSSCNCFSCKNPFGIHEVVAEAGQTKSRKRVKQSSQIQRSASRKYISKKGENVIATGWTNTERFIFDSCCDFLTKKSTDLNWSNITGFMNC